MFAFGGGFNRSMHHLSNLATDMPRCQLMTLSGHFGLRYYGKAGIASSGINVCF